MLFRSGNGYRLLHELGPRHWQGHGTEPHLGSGIYGSTNSVTMIAFEDEKPLEDLIQGIRKANEDIHRPADRIRLFQMPLDRIV